VTLSLQEISDRLEIQELLTAYSHAVDRRRWDDLDDLFTPDAVIDYQATGSIKGSLADLKTHLLQVMPMMLSYQHLVGTSALTLSGDRAEGRSICFNPMVIDSGEGNPPRVFFCGLWYRDRFIRQADGWRFAHRVQELSYFYDFPGGSPAGASAFGFPA